MMSGTAFKGPPIQDRQVLNPWSQPIEEKNNYATVQKQLKPRVPAKPQPSLSHNQVQTTDLNLIVSFSVFPLFRVLFVDAGGHGYRGGFFWVWVWVFGY